MTPLSSLLKVGNRICRLIGKDSQRGRFISTSHTMAKSSCCIFPQPSVILSDENEKQFSNYPTASYRIVQKRCYRHTVCYQSIGEPISSSVLSFSLSPREQADLEDFICTAVAAHVEDPVTGQRLVDLNWLHKRIAWSKTSDKCTPTTLQLLLRIPSLLHPDMDELKRRVKEHALSALQEWTMQHKPNDSNNISNVAINVEVLPVSTPIPFMARLVEDHEQVLKDLGPGLKSVAHFVAVYSCKGGVGKSSVAVNLAYELAAQGGRIGLLDLDLFGPSLPLLVRPDDVTLRRSPLGPGAVYPIQHHNVKLLSLGYVNTHSGVPGSGSNNGATIMKGPMAVKVVSQLLKGTDWGDLDVLILDLPPGTGDIQLAVLQQLQLSGAVAVTTPSKLATADTRKGIEMFTSLGVPTIAVVENMSYFEDPMGGRHFPFGKGVAKDLFTNSNTIKTSLVELPISAVMTDSLDTGIPFTITRPKEAEKELAAFRDLAKIVSHELLQLQYGSTSEMHEHVVFETETTNMFSLATVTLTLDKANNKFTVRLYSDSGAVQKPVGFALLRSCDPKTGEIIPDSPYTKHDENHQDIIDEQPMVTKTKSTGKKSPSVMPIKVERRGRYGFAVEWGDGATIIYSMRCLAIAAGGVLQSLA